MMRHRCLFLIITLLTLGTMCSIILPAEPSNATVINTQVPHYVLPTESANLQKIARLALCLSPNPAIYGLTVGTVYCVKQFISYSVKQYTSFLANNSLVKKTQFGCYTIALILLGVRFMTMNTASFMRDSMLFLIKLVISIYLITHSADIYDKTVAAIGEGIGIVGQTFDLTPTDACFIMEAPKALLQAVDPGVNYDEYGAWHGFDCILLRVFGITASKPLSSINTPVGSLDVYQKVPGLNMKGQTDSGLPALVAASMMIIIVLAGGTMGLIILILGVTFIVTLLKTLFRTVFVVLSAYILLATMAILMPLFAPLLIFSSHTNDSYTRKIFDRFFSTIIGCFLHPIILIAFIGFMYVTIDSLIEGDISKNTSIQAIYSNCKTEKPAASNTSGKPNICSFNQLFHTFAQEIGEFLGYTGANTAAKATMFSDFSYITDFNQVLLSWKQVTDPQAASVDCKMINYAKTFIPLSADSQANQVEAKAVGFEIPGPKRLKVSYVLLQQFFYLLITLVLVTMLLARLLEELHQFVGHVTQSAAASVLSFRSPIDRLLDEGSKGLISGVASAKTPSGVMGALQGMPTKAFKGAEGAMQGIFRALGRRK